MDRNEGKEEKVKKNYIDKSYSCVIEEAHVYLHIITDNVDHSKL